MTNPEVLVEVCVDSVEKAVIAAQAGAQRIELNTALELDGLSPTPSLLMAVVEHTGLPVISMARPRPGNFCYSDIEWKILKDDASWMLDMGAAGIATGCLLPNGNVDAARLAEMRALTHGKQLVFHLAFEEVPNWQSALDCLIGQGVDRVMTRGGAASAIEGVAQIQQISEQAADRIQILPAGRIGSSNARQITIESGCNQVHGSFASHILPEDLATEIGVVEVFNEIKEVVRQVNLA